MRSKSSRFPLYTEAAVDFLQVFMLRGDDHADVIAFSLHLALFQDGVFLGKVVLHLDFLLLVARLELFLDPRSRRVVLSFGQNDLVALRPRRIDVDRELLYVVGVDPVVRHEVLLRKVHHFRVGDLLLHIGHHAGKVGRLGSAAAAARGKKKHNGGKNRKNAFFHCDTSVSSAVCVRM
jgi:hypothetical protein